jgi:lysophospholipase L1-like esterase
MLADFAQSRDIPFLDLLPIFRDEIAKRVIDPSVLLHDPLHLSSTGHALAAEAIFAFLTQLAQPSQN